MSTVLRHLTLSLVIAACGSEDSVGRLVPFTYVQDHQAQATVGTAHDDLWHVTAYGKAGQEDPYELQVQYWNGADASIVALSDEVFREGNCGRPGSVASVARGELWLGSFHVPNCGINPSPAGTFDRIIFGRLKADGTWEDHSADFPMAAVGTYKAITLTGRAGVLYATITLNVAGPSTFELYRYGVDGTRTQLAFPAGEVGGPVAAIGADELVYTGTNNNYLYTNGAWVPLGLVGLQLGPNHINVGSERWSFGGIVDQSSMATLYRFDGAAVTEVPLTTTTPLSGSHIPLTLVPRGSGKATWFFVQRAVKLGGLTVSARDIDGTTLGSPRTVGTAGACTGNSEQCLARDARISVLPDGSAVVGYEGGNLWRYVVAVDEL